MRLTHPRSPLLLVLVLVLAAVALSACGSLIERPQSFEERIAYAYGTYGVAIESARFALSSDRITSDQAEEFYDQARAVRELIDDTYEIYRLGHAAEAERQLVIARGAVNALSDLLSRIQR